MDRRELYVGFIDAKGIGVSHISEELIRNYSKEISSYPSLAKMLEKFAQLGASYIRNFLRGRGYGDCLLL